MVFELRAVLRDVRRRVMGVVGRAIVLAVDDAKKMQELQLLVDVGVKRSEVEHFQNYGFTSKPKAGAEAVVVNVGGNADHPIAIAVDDRRYRVKELEDGEVCVYDQSGTRILLKANGNVSIAPSNGVVELGGDLEVDGSITVTGDVTAEGNVHADGDVTAGAISLANHTHTGGTYTTTCGAGAGSVNGGASGGPL